MMKEILLITENAERRTEIAFAGRFAAQNELRLVVAQTQAKKQNARQPQSMLAQHARGAENHSNEAENWTSLAVLHEISAVKPRIVDTSRFNENELVAFIRKENFAMVISSPSAETPNLQAILNQLSCPLLLLPEILPSMPINRMAYLTDLRYCQQPVLNNLSDLRGSSLLLAHVCQQGLPDVSPGYGEALFADTIGKRNTRFQLFFSHIRDTDMQKISETLISTLHVDVLVCVNRQFHFQQLWGDRLPDKLPSHITVPVLIYPN